MSVFEINQESLKYFVRKLISLVLVETRDCLDYPDNLFADLRSYNVFRKPRNVFGGGVAFIVKKGLKGFRRTDLEIEGLELLVIELTITHLVIGVLRATKSDRPALAGFARSPN